MSTPEKLKPEVLAITAEAGKIVVANAEQCEAATEFIRTVKAMAAKVHEICDPVCEATNKAHKAATGMRAKLLEPLEEAESRVKVLSLRYWSALEHARKCEEARRMAAAMEAAARNRDEEAALFDALDDAAAAAAVLAAPLIAAPIAEVPKVAIPKGMSMPSIWKARVIDFALVPDSCKMIDQAKADAWAKATHGTVAMGGLEAYEDKQVRVSR